MALVRRVIGIALVVVLLLAIFGGGWLVGRTGIGSVVDPASLTEAERQFAEAPDGNGADEADDGASEAVATDPDEEAAEVFDEQAKRRSRLLRAYKIQEVIKRRQILLVQVVKEERGTKGAALTTYLSPIRPTARASRRSRASWRCPRAWA